MTLFVSIFMVSSVFAQIEIIDIDVIERNTDFERDSVFGNEDFILPEFDFDTDFGIIEYSDTQIKAAYEKIKELARIDSRIISAEISPAMVLIEFDGDYESQWELLQMLQEEFGSFILLKPSWEDISPIPAEAGKMSPHDTGLFQFTSENEGKPQFWFWAFIGASLIAAASIIFAIHSRAAVAVFANNEAVLKNAPHKMSNKQLVCMIQNSSPPPSEWSFR
jgi:hypothetical protein